MPNLYSHGQFRMIPFRQVILICLFILIITTQSEAVTVSGTVYTDEGTSRMSGGVTVRVVVEGVSAGTDTTSTTNCATNAAPCGAYNVSGVTINATTNSIIAYLDTNGGNVGTVITHSTSAVLDNTTGFDIYQNHIAIEMFPNNGNANKSASNPWIDSANDACDYDKDNDTDMPYQCYQYLLYGDNNIEFYIWSASTFSWNSASTAPRLNVDGVDIRGRLLRATANFYVVDRGDWNCSNCTHDVSTTDITTFGSGSKAHSITTGNAPFGLVVIDEAGQTVSTTDELLINGNVGITVTAGTLSLGAKLQDYGDLTIGATGTLTTNNYQVNVGDDFVINSGGVFNAGSGTVSFSGFTNTMADQTVTTSGQLFNNVYINNTQGSSSDDIIPTDDWDIDGNLIINDGNLNMSTNNKSIILAGNWVREPNTNHTWAKGTGNSTVTFDGGSTSTFSNNGLNASRVDNSTYDFNKVDVTNNTTLKLVNGELEVDGTLTIASGATVNLNGQTLDLNGTLNNNGTLKIQGNETDVDIGVMDNDSGTVMYIGDGNGTSNVYAVRNHSAGAYYNLTINDTNSTVDTFTFDAQAAINGTLTVANGNTLGLNGQTLNMTGATLSNSGTITMFGSETVTVGTWDNDSGTIVYVGNGDGVVDTRNILNPSSVAGTGDFYNLRINDTNSTKDVFALQGDLDVDGDLTISSGTLDVSTNNYAIVLAGTWFNSGTFASRSGTVTFNGTIGQGITFCSACNTTSFSSVVLTNASSSGVTFLDGFTTTNLTDQTAGSTVTVAASSTSTISGAMTMQGTSSSQVRLKSGTSSTQFTFDVPGVKQNVFNVNVSDSAASSNDIVCHSCTNGGGTDAAQASPHWEFSSIISGVVYTDEGTSRMSGGVTVRVVVEGVSAGTDTTSTTNCATNAAPCGAYNVSGVTINATTNSIIAYLDTNGGNVGTVITHSTSAVLDNTTGFDIYQNHIAIEMFPNNGNANKSASNPWIDSANDACDYDKDNDTDMPYQCYQYLLYGDNNIEFYIWSASTFSWNSASTAPRLNVDGVDIRGRLLRATANFYVVDRGDWNCSNCTHDVSTTDITTFGSGSKAHSITTGNAPFGLVVIDEAGQTVSTTDELLINGNVGITVTAGTLSLGAKLQDYGDLTIGATGTLTTNNYQVNVGDDFVINSGGVFNAGSGTVSFSGFTNTMADQTVTTSGQLFNNVYINNTQGSSSDDIIPTDDWDIDGNLIINDGNLNMSTNNKSIILAGNWVREPNTNHTWAKGTGNSTVTFDGGSTSTFSNNGLNASRVDNSTYDFNKVDVTNNTTLKLVNGELEVDGTLTIASGATVNLNGQTLDLNGTLNNNGTLKIQGNETDVDIGVMDNDSGTVMYIGDGNGTSNVYAVRNHSAGAYYNLTINDTNSTVDTFTFDAQAAINGTLTVANGNTLGLNGQTLNMTGATLSNSGTITMFGSETVTVGTWDNDSGTIVYVGNGDGVVDTRNILNPSSVAGTGDFYNLRINDTNSTKDVFALQGDLDVDGDLTISSGTLDVSTNNYAIVLAGTWFNSGTFASRSGTVTFNGTIGQGITFCSACNTTSFSSVVLTNASSSGVTFLDGFTTTNLTDQTAGSTVTVAASSTSTISGTLTLQGTHSSEMRLKSSSGGTQFTLNVTGGNQKVYHVNVSDSAASSNDINCRSCTNGGGTDAAQASPHWVFSPLVGAVMRAEDN